MQIKMIPAFIVIVTCLFSSFPLVRMTRVPASLYEMCAYSHRFGFKIQFDSEMNCYFVWFFVYNYDDGHNHDDNMMNLSLLFFCHFFSFSLDRCLFLAFSISSHLTASCLVCWSLTDFVNIANAMLWPIVVSMIWKCGIYNWKKKMRTC